MTNLLSKFSTKRLEKEIESRYKQKAIDRAKKIIKSKSFTFGVEYDLNPHRDFKYGPYYILGIVKDGKFYDFYYESGLEPEDWGDFVPDGWGSPMESTYEYSGKTLQEGLEVLKEMGYTYFKDITGLYD